MSRWLRTLLLLGVALVAANGWLSYSRGPANEAGPAAGAADETSVGRDSSDNDPANGFNSGLPQEAVATLAAIEHGGPFAYERDGVVFENREGRLPTRPRGYYREYTVTTPGARDRGARRIVAGGEPPEVFYYSDDHYATFRAIKGAPP